MHDPLSSFTERLRRFIAAGAGRHPEPAPDGEDPFNTLALELFHLQRQALPLYDRYCALRPPAPPDITSWRSIPALPVDAFKEFEISSLPPAERTAVFHSSGTTGDAPSRHFHHPASLALYETSALAWFRPHLLHELPPEAVFVSLTPPPTQAPHSSLVHMLEAVRTSRPWSADSYLGHLPDPTTGWQLEADRALDTFRQAIADGKPLVVLGTAFSFVALLDLLEHHCRLPLRLPPGSRVMETGGYKGRTRALPRPELHAWITRTLGVPRSHLVCEYGMSELSSQAYDHAAGSLDTQRRFRFPPWARARIVSPETLAEVSVGETGLVEILDLANVRSVAAIRTGDLAIRQADGFDLLGRLPTASPRGCSLLVA